MLLDIREAPKKRKTPEQYFKEELGEKSEDFLMLKKLVEETNGRIAWKELEEHTKIKNGKVEGIYGGWCLSLVGTNITSLGKIKKVGGCLNLKYISSLKDIGELEEISGYLCLIGTSVELQLEVMRKVKNGELNVEGEIYYNNEAAKQYFKEELGEKSEDFLMLNKFPKKYEGEMSWAKLVKYTKIKNGKVEGIYWEESLNLRGSSITSLGKLKKVGGFLNLENNSNLKDLGKLEEVGGNLYLSKTGITSLGKLRKVGGDLDLFDISNLKDLGELKEVGGDLDARWIKITSLGTLEKVGGSLNLEGAKITSLGNLKKVKKNLSLYKVINLKDIGELEEVGGNLYVKLTNVEIETIERLNNGKLTVGGKVFYDEDVIEKYFIEKLGENSEDFLMLKRLVEETNGRISWEKLKKYTKIENGKIEGIYREDDLGLCGTDIKSLQKIKKVIGGVYLYDVSSLKDIGELEEIGGDLDIRGTGVASLGKLKKVGGFLNLENNSNLKDLGKLEEVGGNLDVRGTNIELQLKVIRKIKKGELVIEGDVHYDNSFRYLKEMIENRILDKEMILNYKLFEEKYGIKVKEIEDEKIKGQVKSFLMLYLKILRISTIKEIVKIMKEDITQEEKKEKIGRLYGKYKVYIQKIDLYLI